jgi:hypothetical protein
MYKALMQIQVSKDPFAIAEFRSYADRQFGLLTTVINDLPQRERESIVFVMGAVLQESLRVHVGGRCSMIEVYRRLDRSADLICPLDEV